MRRRPRSVLSCSAVRDCRPGAPLQPSSAPTPCHILDSRRAHPGRSPGAWDRCMRCCPPSVVVVVTKHRLWERDRKQNRGNSHACLRRSRLDSPQLPAFRRPVYSGAERLETCRGIPCYRNRQFGRYAVHWARSARPRLSSHIQDLLPCITSNTPASARSYTAAQ